MIIKRLPTALVLLLSLLFAASTYADTQKSFLWKVQLQSQNPDSDHRQEVSAHILGSVHFADKRFYPLSKAIESAFQNASALVLEANLLAVDNAQLNTDMQARGFYPAGQSIADHISADTLKMLKEYLTKNKIPYKNIEKLRPIMLAVGLTSAQLLKLGFSPEQGIDLHFAKRAQGKKKHPRT